MAPHRETVRVGLDPDWPPFSFLDREGRWTGVDVELLALIEEVAGIELELLPPMPWPELYALAAAGGADALASTAQTEERHLHFLFTEPYLRIAVAIITRADGPFLLSLNELLGQRVAASRNHAITEFLRRDFPGIDLLEVETDGDALLAVARGEADAVIVNLAIASHIIRDRGLANLKISGVTRYSFPQSFAIHRSRPDLLEAFNQALAQIPEDRKAAILARWIHVQHHDLLIWERLRPYALKAGLLVLLVVAGVFLWNRRLSAEIARRRIVERELLDAQERLRQANEDKSHILAMAAHDLRSPLTNILFQMEVLRMRKNPSHADLEQANERVVEQSNRIHHMINQLLTVDALDAGRQPFDLVETDLRDLLAKTVSDHRSAAARKEIEIDYLPPDDPLVASVDKHAFAQILDNLLSNAIKFSPKGGRVTVRLEKRMGRAEVRVSDTGPGFSLDDHAHLFQKFRKLSARPTGGESSTGLGLSISRRLVEQMNGRILVERESEGGARLRVQLPLTANS